MPPTRFRPHPSRSTQPQDLFRDADRRRFREHRDLDDITIQNRTTNGMPKVSGTCGCGGTILAAQLVMDPPKSIRVCDRCGSVHAARSR